MRWLAWIAATCLACAGGGSGTSPDDPGGEWVREYDGVVPDTELYKFDVFFVRDGETGRPIAGARVAKHPEDWLDENGDWAPLWAERKTDEFGVAWFPREREEYTCHWAVSADGYAPAEEYGDVGPYEETDLFRGEEGAGYIFHPDGRPAAGVRLSHKVGCAHSPSLAHSVTDKDGKFVFPAITDGEITFNDARFFSQFYWTGNERPQRWNPPTLWMEPAGEIRGRVVKADGTVPEWAVVWTGTRAPRALVDSRGHFVLRGAKLGTRLFVRWIDGDAGDTQKFLGADRMPGGTAVLIVGANEEKPPDTLRHDVEVRVRDVKGGWPLAESPVYLDRPSDGRRFTDKTDPYHFKVEPGHYELSVGNPNSRYYAPPRPIEITGPTVDAPVEVAVQEHALLTIVSVAAAGGTRTDLEPRRLTIQLDDRFWNVDTDKANYLPAYATATLRVDLGEQTLAFRIGDVEDGVREARIYLPGAKQLRFPDLSGKFAAELLWIRDDVESSDEELWTRAVGIAWLTVKHPEKGRALKKLELPWEATEPIEIRDLEFEPIVFRELRVVDAAGRPVEEFSFDTRDDISPPGCYWYEEPANPEPGVARSVLFHDGAWVKIWADGVQEQFVQLKGAGPYEVRLGSARLEIELAGYEEAAVVLDGYSDFAGEYRDITLAHIHAGPHTLLIGATGFVPQIHRIVLKEGETRTITPTLRKRADAAK